MPYSHEQIEKLEGQLTTIAAGLLDLYASTAQLGQTLVSTRAKEHLLQGASRRLNVLRGCLINVFELFPVSATSPIASERLYDVQINLHAFVINLSGIFDNYAWSFIYQHGLEAEFANPRSVGLFTKKVQSFLPSAIRDFLQASGIRNWHREYLTNYRDALAHRIPLYVPPSVLNPEKETRFRELEAEINDAVHDHDWEKRDELWGKQSQLGFPCFSFVHSFNEAGPSRDVLLHPQMLSDAMTVTAFGRIYLANCNTPRP